MQFEYDERGSTFYYFLVSFYALVLIPATYYLWPRSGKKDNSSDSKSCRCDPCLLKDKLKKSNEPYKKLKNAIIKVIFILLWIGFALLAYKASQIETEHIEWNPYTVLGLDSGASVAEVKKAYRELSKIHHPDRGGNEKRFVEITKAHLSLTDEESKKNYDLYGNPDGPGAQSFGIALPSWLVSKEYSLWVLAVYGLIFMVIMPTAVGIWWYRSIKYSADSVLMDTTRLFCIMILKTHLLNVKRVLAILSGSFEYSKQYNKEVIERPTDDIELPILFKQFDVDENKKERPLCFPYSIKARCLLYAHLARHPLDQETLNKDLQLILKKCPYLIQELIQVYLQVVMWANTGRVINNKKVKRPALNTVDNIMRASPIIVQACKDNKSPLIQLPHITESTLKHFVTKKRRVKTCMDLARLSNDDRRALLRTLSDRKYQDVMVVLASMPQIEMEIRLEVRDDEEKERITAGALVVAVVKLTRKPLFDISSLKNSSLSNNVENSKKSGITESSSNSTAALDVDKTEDENEENIDISSLKNSSLSNNVVKNSKKSRIDESSSNGTAALDVDKTEDGNEENVDEEDNAEKVGDSVGDAASALSVQEAKRNIWEKPKKKKGGKNAAAKKKKGAKIVKAAPSKKTDGTATVVTSNEEQVEKVKNENESGGDDSDDENDASSDEKASKDAASNDRAENDDDDFDLNKEFSRKEKILETKSKITHLVHSPYFPEDKYEYWWLYLCDRKKEQLICPPTLVTTLVDDEEVELRFTAPINPGTYSIQVCLRSDSYLDCDEDKNVKYLVHEAKQITSHPQWEFDEDKDKESDHEASDDASQYTEDGNDSN